MSAGKPGMSGPPGHSGSACAGVAMANPAAATAQAIAHRAVQLRKRESLMTFPTSLSYATCALIRSVATPLCWSEMTVSKCK